MSKQILNIPIGYAASFTTDALTEGSYVQYDNIYTGYDPVTIETETDYVIGPFNEVTNFLFELKGAQKINFSLDISGVYTQEDAEGGGGGGDVTDGDVIFTDNTDNDASTDMHGYLPKLSGDDTEYLNGVGEWASVTADTINDSDVVFNDNTDGDATDSAHGFCPKLSGDSGEFLNGEGVFATPAGGGGSSLTCRVVAGTSQSTSSGVRAKVQFNTARADATTSFDTTNYKFIPQVAGVYFIYVTLGISGAVASTGRVLEIVKNTTPAQVSSLTPVAVGTGQPDMMQMGALVELNGSTDYVEIYYTDYGGAGSLLKSTDYSSTASIDPTAFNAYKVG